jgi:parvulin-like peptidyl-prolyl isomerase
VTVSSTEFAAARAQLVKTFPTEADADKQLQDSYGWSLDKYMDEVVKPTLLEKDLQSWFLARTDDEAKKYQVDEVHAKHILFPVAAGADDAKVKATAEAVLARIKKGEDFDKVGNDLALKDQAKKLEPGVSGVIMEDLGWFGHGRMVKEFETAAFAAKAGDLIGPIKTNFGYHIIHVIEKRRANSFETYMQEELKKASIVIFGSIHNPFEQLLGGTASSTDNATVTPDSAQ